MRNFVIFDDLLFHEACDLLTSKGFEHTEYGDGVFCYKQDDVAFFVINPNKFSPAAFTSAIKPVSQAQNFYVIAPSMVQYFASGIKKEDSIFSAIKRLSKLSPVIDNAAVFRMTDEQPQSENHNRYKHRLSYSSLPMLGEDDDKIDIQYIDSTGECISERSLKAEFNRNNLDARIERISVPLIFYLSNFNKKKIEKKGVFVKKDDGNFKFDRVAYGELMLRFPSREYLDAEERKFILGLVEKAGDSVSDLNIDEIWEHNRSQWELVRKEKLSFINASMEGPTESDSEDHYHHYNHLIMSGFNWVADRLGVIVPNLKHIGIPLFARNGVTIALANDGIIKTLDDTFEDQIQQQIHSHLNAILASQDLSENDGYYLENDDFSLT